MRSTSRHALSQVMKGAPTCTRPRIDLARGEQLHRNPGRVGTHARGRLSCSATMRSFLNPRSALAVALLVIPACVWRIHVEEPMLMQIPGYADYARGRARLLPGLR
jgi:hypothetical protein